jgi:hypothetical protein
MGCCGVVNASLGAPCNDDGGLVCDGHGACISSHCSDGVKDADETDVDCGGASCAACADGKTCLANHDCVDGVCNAGHLCAAPSCTDAVQNGAETDVDCGGGTCPACPTGDKCKVDGDCASGGCDALSLTCVATECSDHHLDGTETDVDCGGPSCPACPTGDKCKVDRDCTTAACDALTFTCDASQCTDHLRDGTETDVDCGGLTCPACAAGMGCLVDSDCSTTACSATTLQCVANQCADGHRDGSETDVDCGGGLCPACALGKGCAANADCTSTTCDFVTDQCVSTTCGDQRKDGSETDVDCGGGTCPACPTGDHCAVDTDCASMACDAVSLLCVASQCADHRQDGLETDVDCGGGICPACPTGDKCLQDANCISNACDGISLLCMANQCADHRKDGLETDVDCGGGTCAGCALGKGCAANSDCSSATCDFVTGQCVASTCSDQRKDGAETDVDCGGTCPVCPTGDHCMVDTDCASMACDAVSLLCVASQCADHRKDGLETDVDCGGGICPACALGKKCIVDTDCPSNACDAISLICVASQCTDHRQDGLESDVDCGGSVCASCAVGMRCNTNFDCQGGHFCNASSHVCQ